MKYIVNILRILVGALFIFSGAVKAIDPLGTSYKMHDYYAAFGTIGLQSFWDKMNDFSTPIAVIMIVVEIFAGFALLTGWKPKLTVWILFAMTLFFTLLTGFTYLSGYCPTSSFAIYSILTTVMIIAAAALWKSGKGIAFFLFSIILIIAGLLMMKYSDVLLSCEFDETKMKVTDCGCFGDAIKLKPWETFWKDIILDVMIFILVIGTGYIKPIFKPLTNHIAVFAVTALALLFCFSNFVWGLPVIDFRPYKVGNNIRDLRIMKRPEKRDYFFVYKNLKTGQEQGFKVDQLNDLNMDEWEFVSRKDSIIDAGVPAVINNLIIMNEDGEDITDTLLSDPEYSLMIVSYKLGKANVNAFVEKINPLAAKCDKVGIHIYAITSGDIDAEEFRHQNQCAYPFLIADETPLKTIIRSNPGMVLLKNGVVINQWHHMHFPDFEKLNSDYFHKPLP